jgi:hypothetical protein
MKITKSQLRQIIKEELTQTLQEEERLDEGGGVMLMLASFIGLLMLSAKTHEEKAAAIKQKIETTTDQEGVSFLRKVLDGMQSAATSLKGGDTSKWEEFTTDIDQAAAEDAAAKEREKEARRPDITMKDIEDLRKLEEIIKEELGKALNEAEDLDPAIVNGWLLRIVSGVRSLGEEPPDHPYGGRHGVTPHENWQQKEEEVRQAITKINNGEYTKEELARAKTEAAKYQHPDMTIWMEKAEDIKIPLPEPKSKIGSMMGKLKDRFGLEEAL